MKGIAREYSFRFRSPRSGLQWDFWSESD